MKKKEENRDMIVVIEIEKRIKRGIKRGKKRKSEKEKKKKKGRRKEKRRRRERKEMIYFDRKNQCQYNQSLDLILLLKILYRIHHSDNRNQF